MPASIPDSYKPFLDDLKRSIFCRIKPSKTHGVGVFAIRTIPKGTSVFSSTLPSKLDDEGISIPQEYILQNGEVPDGVKQIIRDFMTFHDGLIDLPTHGLNELNVSFYLNHSDTPNVETADGETFVALRDILEGEELFSDYRTYSEDDPMFGFSKNEKP